MNLDDNVLRDGPIRCSKRARRATEPATSSDPDTSNALASTQTVGQAVAEVSAVLVLRPPVMVPTLTRSAPPQTQSRHSVTQLGSGVSIQIQEGHPSKHQLSMDLPRPQGESDSLLNGPEFAGAMLSGSSAISKAIKLKAEATKFMDQMEFLGTEYKKVLAASTAQAKDVETLNSTCNKQRTDIDSLKTSVLEKDKMILVHERRCGEQTVKLEKAQSRVANVERQAEIAQEKIYELENKLKVKEEEAAQVNKMFEEVSNSLIDRMSIIQKTLGPLDFRGIDFNSLEMPKKQVITL